MSDSGIVGLFRHKRESSGVRSGTLHSQKDHAMHIQTRRLALQLRHPFKLSYGTTTVRENVLFQVSAGAHSGVGEAAVVPYYGETAERIIQYLSDPALEDALSGDPLLLGDALDRLPAGMPPAARAAVDIALHDLWGKHLGHPLYRLWGLNPARIPLSSFTIAMADDEDEYREQVREARDHGLIKLKLGSGDWRADLRYVQMACQETRARLCVNQWGWSADEAAAIIPPSSAGHCLHRAARRARRHRMAHPA